MKFSDEKKKSIKMYILEKIEQNVEGISKYVSQELGISRNTVHAYLNELQDEKIIRKSKRGSYELISNRFEYRFTKDDHELKHDTYAYDKYLYPLIATLPANAEHIWNYGISEMVNNVIDHSGAGELCMIIVQNYLSTSVMLIDNGIGIFRNIKEHFSFANLDDAVCELFKGKLTTDADNHSGEGIFFTSKMMDSFFIISDGKVFTTTKYSNDRVLDAPDFESGTCVYMKLSNFTNRRATDVFNLYSDVECGFFKTRIPLKNIFDKIILIPRHCDNLMEFQIKEVFCIDRCQYDCSVNTMASASNGNDFLAYRNQTCICCHY